jgi:hypothetical protein
MIRRYRALSARVIAVASVNEDVGDWAAYIDAVPGKRHDDEWQEVARSGNKLQQSIAEILFPDCTQYRWRQ